MLSEKERTLAMLTSSDDRLKEYLRDTPSPDDVVRDVTKAFAGDVARIMASVGRPHSGQALASRVTSKRGR